MQQTHLATIGKCITLLPRKNNNYILYRTEGFYSTATYVSKKVLQAEKRRSSTGIHNKEVPFLTTAYKSHHSGRWNQVQTKLVSNLGPCHQDVRNLSQHSSVSAYFVSVNQPEGFQSPEKRYLIKGLCDTDNQSQT